MKKKNIVLLGITILSFIFLIIATFAFGFKYTTGWKFDLSYLKGATWDISKNSYGLMVSGLVFSSITMIITTIFVWLSSSKTQLSSSTLKWMQISIYGLFVLSIILTLAGEALLLSKYYELAKELQQEPQMKFSDYWDSGSVAGLFIFTLLPLPLLIIPCFIKK